ncbi:unnamed protein product [Calypogeia fissa]
MGLRKHDFTDRLVVFLAKRDGIDKLVKTFQYSSKIVNWYLLTRGNTELAVRAKNWEVSCGLSRKCFRMGRFLTGYNTVRTTNYEDWRWQLLAVLSNSGEFVYFFFDHFTWLSRIGLLDKHLADRFCFISAFGEAFGYTFFIISDLIMLKKERIAERKYLKELDILLNGGKVDSCSSTLTITEQVKERKAAIAQIRFQRVMRIMATAANVADYIIDLGDIAPNPFVTHAITLGISGLTSAWTGWYRNWPRELV